MVDGLVRTSVLDTSVKIQEKVREYEVTVVRSMVVVVAGAGVFMMATCGVILQFSAV
ncbi:hypothetical protein GO013_04320 [Pseudodesulfovibrio sp. JC047]|uniref:hypothetical protein n=1 Tax=Pseudodesulfovibrio sp. JC047 TaxID=2683199 RepID=UPI0013D466E5|nr:hypothetical protein [Pseudodesulfovibrio sp. JC047]NDV18644.1 hypothetical protein [Pseudodesulfovibrio sp. JC047]